MKTLTFRSEQDQEPYRIDAAALNEELADALGGWCNGWSASHNAHEAIVDLSDERSDNATVKLVTDTVNAHIANTAKREHNKAIQAQIEVLEYSLTPRMIRDALLGDSTRVQAVEKQIAALRSQRWEK